MTNTDLSTKELFRNTECFQTLVLCTITCLCVIVYSPLWWTYFAIICSFEVCCMCWTALQNLTKYKLISDRCLFLLCNNKVILRENELSRLNLTNLEDEMNTSLAENVGDLVLISFKTGSLLGSYF